MEQTTLARGVVTAYGLAYGGFLLLGGRAADLLGRRPMIPAWPCSQPLRWEPRLPAVSQPLGLTPISDRPSEGRADLGCETRRQ
jgi:hypothetical protein